MKKVLSAFVALLCILLIFASCTRRPSDTATTVADSRESSKAETQGTQTMPESMEDTSGALNTSAPDTATTQPSSVADTMTSDEIVRIFTLAANKVKSEKPGYTFSSKAHTEKGAIDITDNVPFHGFISDYIASTINKSETEESTVAKGADHTAYPAKGQPWSSRLSADALKRATVTDLGGVYDVELIFRDEKLPDLPEKPELTAHGKAFSLQTKQEFREGFGGFNVRFLGLNVRVDIDKFELLYTGSRIRCKIDKTNNRLQSAEYYLNTYAEIETLVQVNNKEYIIGINMEYAVTETYTF